MAECTCRVWGPGYEETETDPSCPFHGDEGTMVAELKPTATLDRMAPPGGWKRPVCLPCWRNDGHMDDPLPGWPGPLRTCRRCGRETTSGVFE